MLSYLRIRGLALLDDVKLELVPGMNVLTGETGAGKSIIVDALTLLRGGRARSELIRAGVEACVVDAQFDLGSELFADVAPLLAEQGIGDDSSPDGDPCLVVKRTVPRAGRGKCFVQSELTTQQVLASVGERLIDICSQHEHHSLTRVAHHVELLDGYARNDALLAAYAECYGAYRDTLRALEALRGRAGGGAARADYLRFQVAELTRLAPEPDERATLRRRVELLRGAHAWAELAARAHEVLYESPDAIASQLGQLLERARRGADQSPLLAELVEQLAAAKAACAEADHLAQRLADEVDLDPADLERCEERLHQLTTLERKHGSLEDLAGLLAGMRDELEELDHAEERCAELAARAAELHATCCAQARLLHEARAEASDKLARALERELAALHLPQARLVARTELLPESELGPRGLDRVELLFSANPGEPPAPLSRVASGGELSRVLLALKSVVTDAGAVATYVFDEVDAGVGGAVAESIGQRLRRAARHNQVLCITHLPQIAAQAHAHFRVEKHTSGGRTTTRVVRLGPEERVEELARMLGGRNLTVSAREHARALLAEAEADGDGAGSPGRSRTSASAGARKHPARRPRKALPLGPAQAVPAKAP